MPLYHTVYPLINNLDSIKYVQQRKQKISQEQLCLDFLPLPMPTGNTMQDRLHLCPLSPVCPATLYF